MAHLKQQFRDALSSIEPGADKTNAPDAHRQVREALETDPLLLKYGIDSVLIGSYKRSVSIKRIKDVDVFVRLPELPAEVTSSEILDHFFKILNKAFGRDDEGHIRTKRQARSLQIAFPEYDLYVDAVPARPRSDGTWEIPERGDFNSWVRTNPEVFTALSSEMNSIHSEYYVPTVKLLRQTRRALLGKSKPGGFFVEVATFQAFDAGAVGGNDQAEYYSSALRAVSEIIGDFVDRGVGVKDPTLPGCAISIRATVEELTAIAAELSRAALEAESALNEIDEGKAALTFRRLLGKNGDGEQVFPMPYGYNDDGSKRASVITPGERSVPAGTKTFG